MMGLRFRFGGAVKTTTNILHEVSLYTRVNRGNMIERQSDNDESWKAMDKCFCVSR